MKDSEKFDCKRFLTLDIYNRHESYLHLGLYILD